MPGSGGECREVRSEYLVNSMLLLRCARSCAEGGKRSGCPSGQSPIIASAMAVFQDEARRGYRGRLTGARELPVVMGTGTSPAARGAARQRKVLHVLVSGAGYVDETMLAPAVRLLDLIRNDLGLTGTKDACSRGECGACTVLVDGRPVLACLTLARRVGGLVETIEGVAEEAADLRAAFAQTAAFQCGFCTPGQIVRGVALLRAGLPAGERELRLSVSGNICRCTGYQAIVDALRVTARRRAGGSDGSASAAEARVERAERDSP